MISHIDHHIGRIIDSLKQAGLYENTIIIYTSDHGDYNGDHGLIRKNPWLFDNVLRIPMIVRMPYSLSSQSMQTSLQTGPRTKATSADTKSDIVPTDLHAHDGADSSADMQNPKGSTYSYSGCTQHEDILPTLFDLLDIAVPEWVQGHSFAPVLRGSISTPTTPSIQSTLRRYSYFYLMDNVGVQKGSVKLLYYPRHTWPKQADKAAHQESGHNNDTSGTEAGTTQTSGSPHNEELNTMHSFTLLRYPEKTGGYILTNAEEDPLEYHNLIGNPDYMAIESELKNELHDWLLRTPHYFPKKEYLW